MNRIWFKPLFTFIGAVQQQDKILLGVDNQFAIYAMTTDNFGSDSKRNIFKSGEYIVKHIDGENELADILTKSISLQV